MDEKVIIFTVVVVLSVIIVGLLIAMIFMSVNYRFKIRESEANRKGINDIALTPNEPMIAKTDGDFKPGTYTMLSGDGNPFEIIAGGVRHTFNHKDQIVIADGEEITAVSENLTLRKGD